jgi:small subunit ribosomal protein S11e
MKRTITIRRDYMHFIKKYQRFEKRHKMLSAHISPAFRTREGDTVTVGQCRPLSKTVRRTRSMLHRCVSHLSLLGGCVVH